jgi:hypothetical protein
MKMTTKARNALRKSIAHWKRLATSQRRQGDAPTADNCALCLIYSLPESVKEKDNCAGCPVYAATGRRRCRSTPFYAAADEWHHTWFYDLVTPEFRRLAGLELKFLRSLLPKPRSNRRKVKHGQSQ